MPIASPAADPTAAQHDRSERRALASAMAAYQSPSLARSLAQFGTTFALFLAVLVAMYAAFHTVPWLTMLLAFPAAGLTVRLFIIQHDCGHGSFFRSRRLNGALGRFCGAMTFTPYGFWRRQHANHHASFNNLDRRDGGIDIYSSCATLREYRALPPLRRWLYRASRHPVLTQFVLPPIVFLILYRVPFDTPRTSHKRERMSVHATNLAIGAILVALMLKFGPWPVLLVHLPVMALASIVGVWLFSVQHRFEEAQWARQDSWSATDAALHGSSYLKLPRVLQWFTGNIGFHHIHHLASRVPNYRLQACHESNAGLLGSATVLTLREALLAPCYALWDEERGRMLRFRDA